MVGKAFFWSLKVLLLSLAFYFLYLKLDSIELDHLQWNWTHHSLYYLSGFLLLWFLNLLFDAQAWSIVQSILHPISLKTALVHNLKCYGLAFISPMNSGEIAGRYLIQEKPYDRKKALFLTFWTHAPKLFSKAIVSFGILAFMLPNQGLGLQYSLLALLAILISLALYLRLERVISLLHEKELWNRPLKDYLIKGKPTIQQKLAVLAINALRFLLFSSQMALVLLAFKPELLTWQLYWSIPLYYFISALIPSYTGIDFIIKGTLALYFFDVFETDALSFTLASTAVWFFNWAIPAIVGLSSLKKVEIDRLKRKRA
ncbi:lysylphosphatidylglycerol synthase domain-containing protein [Croceimicrobium hydrocarbonivorans]|uniref:Flippase-like domain-containing protein n=1 Tax=Croceimicrobium hydrocarbonivorans TaxID=2761580 RepID=A0A7H0VBH8_9FLAO|nr:lysylphosphatidylglycerol synthase domain-containing protein [Croceimicrobium hydrocarbonivorans]QNR23076.1 hypothetical protein H4K34_11885 [Croceimicrobium hydrocarbonivorans]